MSKKLAKYEIDSLVRAATTKCKEAEAIKLTPLQQSHQTELSNMAKLADRYIKNLNKSFEELHALETSIQARKMEMEGEDGNRSFNISGGALSVRESYGSSRRSRVAEFNAPQVRLASQVSSDQIEQAIIIETMKKDFDVDALMKKLVAQFS